jgi:hypothetical protein
LRFPELNSLFDDENGLPSAVAHMNVNREMFIAVKEEPVSVLFEDLWHPIR